MQGVLLPGELFWQKSEVLGINNAVMGYMWMTTHYLQLPWLTDELG